MLPPQLPPLYPIPTPTPTAGPAPFGPDLWEGQKEGLREQGGGWKGGRSREETHHLPLCPPLVFFPLRPKFILSLLNEAPRCMMGCRAPPFPVLGNKPAWSCRERGSRAAGDGHEQFTPNNSGGGSRGRKGFVAFPQFQSQLGL